VPWEEVRGGGLESSLQMEARMLLAAAASSRAASRVSRGVNAGTEMRGREKTEVTSQSQPEGSLTRAGTGGMTESRVGGARVEVVD
jgi:hypothetical protein